MKLRVQQILAGKGKSVYWLHKQMDMSYQNVNHMVKNQTESIQYKTIESLCHILGCTPNDLFELEEE